MKIHAIISFLCLASVALGTSCKDDETHFLQRSHDALSFPYLNSTKELLVLTNGSWKITPDDTWISCSPGEGNGAPKEQAVNITVAQNDGAERTGSVTLSDGLKELVIRVTQEDGFFTVGSPEIAPRNRSPAIRPTSRQRSKAREPKASPSNRSRDTKWRRATERFPSP